jgi:hypothetical protein
LAPSGILLLNKLNMQLQFVSTDWRAYEYDYCTYLPISRTKNSAFREKKKLKINSSKPHQIDRKV